MRPPKQREALAESLPHWAIVTETGAPEAPFVGIWRVGNLVYLATLAADSDACGRMEQLASTVADLDEAKPQALAVQSFRFPSDDDAARFMRDTRRIQRQNGQDDGRRPAGAEIPI